MNRHDAVRGLSAAVAVLTFSLTAPPAPAVRQAPPYTDFWQAAPTRDPDTLFLWQLDDQAEAGEEILDEALLTLPDGEGGGLDEDLLRAGTESVAPELRGGASLVADGRFGGGVRLDGAGALVAARPRLDDILKGDGALTLDFWVWPEAAPAAMCVAFLATARAEAGLAVRLAPDGEVQLTDGETVLLTHPRQAPPGVWTHLAVVVDTKRGAGVLVNGAPQWVAEEARAPVLGLAGELRGALSVGGDPSRQNGLTGRLDAVRLSRRERLFYVLDDRIVADPDRRRVLADGPPWFARRLAPHLYCSFDGSVTPEESAGRPVEGQAPAAAFAPGVRGQALDLSAAEAVGFAVKGIGVLPAEAGSIAFWFRPKDWNNFLVGEYLGQGVPWVNLMRLAPANYEPYRAYKALAVAQGRAGQDHPADLAPFHPGKWTHVAVTWGGEGAGVYLDGVPQRIGQAVLGGSSNPLDQHDYDAWKERTGGKEDGTYRLTLSPSATLLDELCIYPYCLLPEEVWNSYARMLPEAEQAMKRLPAVRTRFEYFAHSWEGIEHLDIGLSCLPVDGVSPVAADVRLAGADGGVLSEEAGVALDKEGHAQIRVTRSLPFGRYPIEVTPRDAGGKALLTHRGEYVRVRPPWYENDLGKERSVPAPWSPIKLDGNVLHVVGREVHLTPGGLPGRIRSLGREVLAAPVELHVRAGGRDLTAGEGALRFAETAADRVSWESRFAAAPLELSVAAWMEYDGLMYYTVTLAAQGEPVTVESVVVSFPLADAVATQLIGNTGGNNFRNAWDVRMLPPGDGPLWSSLNCRKGIEYGLDYGNYFPHIWVGNDDVGLCFSGENDRGWTPDDRTPAQEITREGGTTRFRMNVVSKPVAVTKDGHRFTFILTPTPAKPEPKGWRGWNRARRGTPLSVYDAIDDFVGFPMKSDPAKPESLKFDLEPKSWEAAAQQRQSIREKFGEENPVFLYIDYSWPKPGPSFADWNHDLWAGTGRIAWIPEFEDYLVWVMNEYISRGLIEGVYIDDASLGRTYSLASTAYPVDWNERKRRMGFSTMGFRRFCQRVWKLFEANGMTPHILPHMTYCFELPAFSFCTAIVNGEARMINLGARHDTMDAWSRDELRIMGNGPKWGLATFWKPTVEVNGIIPKPMEAWHYWQCRTLHANVMQADMWYLWHYPTANVILPDLLDFDFSDPAPSFIPYWRNRNLLTAEAAAGADVAAGIFRKPDRALIMVSNFAREDQAVTLALNTAELFGREGTVAWRDADRSLDPPENLVASDAEIAQAAKAAAHASELGDGEAAEPLDEAALLDVLSGVTPREKEQARLAIRPDGNRVSLVVRKRDYRLLEVRLQP
ncbi:MAG: hypothetical protein BWZ02_00683 [Lentisphaerae bacterium ADurb.BinA184]|nr:MAG: hypothetical protein BWZ02_00683 [Lentisphaerae bacterium ADurb.BinA184]